MRPRTSLSESWDQLQCLYRYRKSGDDHPPHDHPRTHLHHPWVQRSPPPGEDRDAAPHLPPLLDGGAEGHHHHGERLGVVLSRDHHPPLRVRGPYHEGGPRTPIQHRIPTQLSEPLLDVRRTDRARPHLPLHHQRPNAHIGDRASTAGGVQDALAGVRDLADQPIPLGAERPVLSQTRTLGRTHGQPPSGHKVRPTHPTTT